MSIIVSNARSIDDLMHTLLRARWNDAELDVVRRFIRQHPPEWSKFLHLADVRSLSPLLYSVTRGRDVAPAEVEDALHQVYFRNAARTAMLFVQLDEVLKVLAEKHVPVILLKGAALIETVYDNAALRPMMDLDMLLHRHDLPVAIQALKDSGFLPDSSEPRPGAMFSFESQIRFFRTDFTQTLIELHWSLLDSPYYQSILDIEWFWQSARPVGEKMAFVFGPEAQIMHLSAHMLLHHGSLIWLGMHDIAEVCYHDASNIDWDALLFQAKKMNLVLPLQTILPVVKTHWMAPIPEDVLERLQRLRATSEEQRVFHWLNQQGESVMHHFAADFLTMPSWEQKWRYILTQVFPSLAYMRQRYDIPSPWLTLFYYPRRWARGLAHLRTLF